jgi:hypothetical protein
VVSHTGPKPIRVRYHSDDLETDVLRVVGHKITCPKCGEVKKAYTWGELRQWLREHTAREHV